MSGMGVVPNSPKLHAWLDPPKMDAGSPCPAIHSDEHRLLCAYYVSDGVLPQGTVAVLRFEGVLQFRLGYPNDEALHGHLLVKQGLENLPNIARRNFAFNLRNRKSEPRTSSVPAGDV
jgi:hypothetical protein